MSDEAEQITIDTFRVKQLVRDPALYAAVGTLVVGLIPEVGEWVAENWIILLPLLTVLAGHFGVRMSSAKALGQFASTLPNRIDLADMLPDTIDALMYDNDMDALEASEDDDDE